ncbi:MAG: glycosyltransferase family 4 protein [Proteobacteria bacterium]|nr:glycosyltransferase family 4 protein [Pseudomonadota bacterium]MBI3499699.1 glycosyltransferase family 4 protein [Pseudomonadota bacterium]
MRLLFYAPLKPIDHPVPSGDRRLGQLLVAALARAGHHVEIACRLRTRIDRGDPTLQARQAATSGRIAARLIRRYRDRPVGGRPEAWFTYHLYYKAPDWLGPAVAAALRIPYMVAEASLAPKRAKGPWAVGHQAVLAALSRADTVFAMSAADAECLGPALGQRTRLVRLKPFLDPSAYGAAAARRSEHRRRLAQEFALEPAMPWLIAVAMMRSGDKLRSYELLGAALARLLDRPWRLLVVGDGPARPAVEAALQPLGSRLAFMGERDAEALPGLYAAADLLVWPAINEAFGMVLLEAQAAGTPVVAGATGGVPEVVQSEAGGVLVPVGDATAFADAVASLLDDPVRLGRLAAETRRLVARDHGIDAAAHTLDAALRRSVAGMTA